MTDIGELAVKIRADASELVNELNRANGVVKSTAREMGGAMGSLKDQLKDLIPELTLLKLFEFGKRAVESTSHLKDLGDRIGFSASTLSALEIPLATAGSNLDEFTAGVNRMNDTLGAASKGNQEAIKAFDDIGLSVAKLMKLTPEQRLNAVVQALGKITDQSKLTEAGQNLLGKAFAALQPTLKEHEFNLGKLVDANKKAGDSMDDKAIDRVSKFGNALARAGIQAKDAFVEAFAAILQVGDYMDEKLKQLRVGSGEGGYGYAKTGIRRTSGEMFGPLMPRGSASTDRPDTVDAATFLNAQGGNAGLLAVNPAQELLFKLRQQSAMAQMSDRDAAAAAAEFALKDLAAKDKTVAVNATMIAQARQYALAIYDANHKITPPDPDNSAFQQYVSDLRDQYEQLSLTDKELAARKAVTDANAAAQKDFNDGIRDTNRITEEERSQVIALTDSYSDMKDVFKEVHDTIEGGLTNIALNFKSAGDAARSFFNDIAGQVLKKGVTGPLADSVTKGLGGAGLFSGIGKLLGFASGGDPPVGVPSIVGENGPEIFVPRSAGTIVPNGRFGGNSVVVQQSFQIYPGVDESVSARIREAAPSIAAAAHASVFDAMRKGGAESRIAGLRH